MKRFFAFILISALCGCTTTVRWKTYHGENRPLQELATIWVFNGYSPTRINGFEVNDRGLDNVYYVIPGNTRIEGTWRVRQIGDYGASYTKANVFGQAYLEAGHAYYSDVIVVDEKIFLQLFDLGKGFEIPQMPWFSDDGSYKRALDHRKNGIPISVTPSPEPK